MTTRQLLLITLLLWPGSVLAQNSESANSEAAASAETATGDVVFHNYMGVPGRTEHVKMPILPGTSVTPQNWETYKSYMSEGMQAFFSGNVHWKVPVDFRIEIGATHDYSVAREDLADTAKYSARVKIVNRPDGGHSLDGYVAGLPFPNPTEPLKGWKLLVDTWFSYEPHLYLIDRFGSIAPETALEVYRKLGHASDYGTPVEDRRGPGCSKRASFRWHVGR